jgi:hypothetical protein
MLHLEGSKPEGPARRPGEEHTCLLGVDDAAGKNPAARWVEPETTKNSRGLRREVVQPGGIPAQLDTDRHSIYWVTEKPGSRVDRGRSRQSGRDLEELGMEISQGR